MSERPGSTMVQKGVGRGGDTAGTSPKIFQQKYGVGELHNLRYPPHDGKAFSLTRMSRRVDDGPGQQGSADEDEGEDAGLDEEEGEPDDDGAFATAWFDGVVERGRLFVEEDRV